MKDMKKLTRLNWYGEYVVMESPLGGRGVFTLRPRKAGTTLLLEPVLVQPDKAYNGVRGRAAVESTILRDYYYDYDGDRVCIPLGLAMLLNHARNGAETAECIMHTDRQLVEFKAVRDLKAGEEITWDYMGGSGDAVWFTERTHPPLAAAEATKAVRKRSGHKPVLRKAAARKPSSKRHLRTK